jgi:hypothetical protein
MNRQSSGESFRRPFPLHKFASLWKDDEVEEIETVLETCQSFTRNEDEYTTTGKVLCLLVQAGRRPLDRSQLSEQLGSGVDKNDIPVLVRRLRIALRKHYEKRPGSRLQLTVTEKTYCLHFERRAIEEEYWTKFAPRETKLHILFNRSQLWVSNDNPDMLHFGDPHDDLNWTATRSNAGSGEVYAIHELTRKLTSWKIDVIVTSTDTKEDPLKNVSAMVVLGSDLENPFVPQLQFPNLKYRFKLESTKVLVEGSEYKVDRWTDKGNDYGVFRRWRDKETKTRIIWLAATTTFGVQALASWLLSAEGIAQLGASIDLANPDQPVEVLVRIELPPAKLPVIEILKALY